MTALPPLPIVEALPGAGKSTVVPLALLDAPWRGDGRIVMLETRVGPRTRIEVATEGILTRMLQHDPALEGVAGVIFDEFRERSRQADLGLALALECQRHLRPELRLLVMSATLDGDALARVMGAARVVRAPGRMFEVETFYFAPLPGPQFASRVAGRIVAALETHEGDLLAFLPGAGEIRRVIETLAGQLAPDRFALLKVIVATNIAETSLTIDGVRIVVDSGLERRNRFDPATGMSRLETVRISRTGNSNHLPVPRLFA